MKLESEKHRLWYDTVVVPKLTTLDQLSNDLANVYLFEHKAFFKELLADLELLSLDNYETENKVEQILGAIEVLKKLNEVDYQTYLADIALIAFLGFFDRILFLNKWARYLIFKKKVGTFSDKNLVNAYRLSALLRSFVGDLRIRAENFISKSDQIVS